MNTFAPGAPGGGNVGIAIDLWTSLRVFVGGPDSVILPASASAQNRREAELLVQSALRVWRNCAHAAAPIRVEIEAMPPRHVGLASSAALQIAVIAAANWLGGLPLSEDEMRRELAASYREAVDGRLVQGFTTGLSSFLNLYGGFAALDETGSVIAHMPVPAWNVVFALVGRNEVGNFGDAEAHVLMTEGRRLDARDASAKRRVIDEHLIPAVARRDLQAVGEAAAAIASLGSKRGEIGLYGTRAQDALETLRRTSDRCVFLSAVGPGVAIFSDRPVAELRDQCAAVGLQVVHEGAAQSTGLEISSLLSP